MKREAPAVMWSGEAGGGRAGRPGGVRRGARAICWVRMKFPLTGFRGRGTVRTSFHDRPVVYVETARAS